MSDQFEREVLMSATGAQLCVLSMTADNARGVVHINHGLAEHAARYRRFAAALAAAGFHVYAHDHRGHGRTTADDAPIGIFSTDGNGVDKVMDDVGSVHALIAERHGDIPIIAFGHSMGGLIAMNFALRRPEDLAGAAVWNANFSGGIAGRAAQLILRIERMRLGSDVPSRMMPKLTFQTWAKSVKDRRTDFDWLSHVEPEVDAYIGDPLCGWDASVSMWRDVFAMIYCGADVANAPAVAKALPLFLAGGTEDPATNGGKATAEQERRLTNADFTQVQCRIFDGARHETLNDTSYDEAVAAFTDWANSVTGRPG